jgi:monovalent cation/hydrogen antiporter
MSAPQVFELLLGLTAACVLLSVVADKLRLPPAAAFTVGGMALALLPQAPAVELDPNLTMLLFVPPLLLASAYFTSWRDFKLELRPILLLAIGAVIFTTLAVGWAAKLVMPGLPLAACFALGAIVSPPDAVAAKAVLARTPLPRRLTTVLEGESLVNDASGLVLYRFAVAATLTGSFNAGHAALQFGLLVVGGIVAGLVMAETANLLFRWLRDPKLAIVMSFLAAWLSFSLGEALGVSGVLAVVACGLRMGWRQHDLLTAEVRSAARAVWGVAVFILEAAVFILIGLSLRGALNRLGGDLAGLRAAMPLAAATVGAVVVSRFLWVYPGTYLPRLLPFVRRTDPFPPAGAPLVLGWAGMRGVVSLTAVLALPEDFPGHDDMVFAVFAVILTTVVVQGATIAPLIHALHLDMPDRVTDLPDQMDYHVARTAVMGASLDALRGMEKDAGEDAHPKLIQEFERRLSIAETLRDSEDDDRDAVRGRHLDAWLEAVDAGRQALVRLHREHRVHDAVLHELEHELDLEELRVRQLQTKVER